MQQSPTAIAFWLVEHGQRFSHNPKWAQLANKEPLILANQVEALGITDFSEAWTAFGQLLSENRPIAG